MTFTLVGILQTSADIIVCFFFWLFVCLFGVFVFFSVVFGIFVFFCFLVLLRIV